ncbi:hypothetical protein [Microbacterium testaceum]|uniref:hypothetical protein n=1 Tax=Microbacterium testaceum TaxID=2033 RepID=UPI001248EB53|nr:hypothetical protein [Microbacterium testaceum]
MTDLFSSREAEACVEGADSGRKNHAHFPTVTLGGHWKIRVTRDFLEAVAEIEKLPDIDATTSPYLLTLSRSGVRTSAFVTLIPRANGTWSATIGDLRESSEVRETIAGYRSCSWRNPA